LAVVNLIIGALVLVTLLIPANIMAATFSKDYVITGVRLIDGSGAEPREDQAIVIKSGRIAAMGLSSEIEVPESLPVLNAAGRTALPGLIDAHVHLPSVPGAAFRQDSKEDMDSMFSNHMRAYLASGVTSVLDAASPEGLAQQVREYFTNGGVGPSVHFLAPFLTPKGGYFADEDLRMDAYRDIWAPVDSVDTMRDHMQSAASLEPTGVKVTIESGMGPFKVWPIFSDQMRQAITKEAANTGLPLFIHSKTADAHMKALEMNPRGLMHAGFNSEIADDRYIDKIASRGVYVVSTLAIYGMTLNSWHPERFDDKYLEKRVPAIQLKTARDPESLGFLRRATIATSTPWWVFPKSLAQWFGGLIFNEKDFSSRLKSSGSAIARMQAAGVPIVLGSDSGSWPAFPGIFHGVSTARELELLGEAGLSNMEAIVAATQNAARMLGIESEVGTIEVGKRADLILLEDDPLIDLSAIRSIEWTIKDGQARRVEDLFN